MISYEIIGISIGILLFGILIGWFISKIKMSRDFSHVLIENKTEIASLSEQIRSKSDETHALKIALDDKEFFLNEKQQEIITLQKQIAGLDTLLKKEREVFAEKTAILEASKDKFLDTFKSLSSSALQENNRSFMMLAQESFSKYLEAAKNDLSHKRNEVKDIVTPVKDALLKYDKHVNVMELEREKIYGNLSQQILSLSGSHKNLQKETGKLVKALQVPHIRGRWGEVTLKRVAELAGMVDKCDFFEQETTKTDNSILRPDMIVRLPGDRNIVVDAKAPLSAYLDALETDSNEKRQEFLETHAKHIHTHIKKLSKKSYYTQFNPSPEFIVLFIPGENFFSAALMKNPALIEFGVEKNVILATPTTLISLLKAVSYGWKQETSSKNAKAISQLGHELYERLVAVSGHLNKLGREIEKSSNTYNQVIGSLEKRVFVSARKLEDMGISLQNDKKIDVIDPVNIKPRQLEMAEKN